MIYWIPFIVLIGSFAGMTAILFRKMPALAEMELKVSQKQGSLSDAKEIIKTLIQYFPGAGKLKYELYLQKALSRAQVLTLKVENKTSLWLEKLRQRANHKNILASHDSNYWKELKKTKKSK